MPPKTSYKKGKETRVYLWYLIRCAAGIEGDNPRLRRYAKEFLEGKDIPLDLSFTRRPCLRTPPKLIVKPRA